MVLRVWWERSRRRKKLIILNIRGQLCKISQHFMLLSYLKKLHPLHGYRHTPADYLMDEGWTHPRVYRWWSAENCLDWYGQDIQCGGNSGKGRVQRSLRVHRNDPGRIWYHIYKSTTIRLVIYLLMIMATVDDDFNFNLSPHTHTFSLSLSLSAYTLSFSLYEQPQKTMNVSTCMWFVYYAYTCSLQDGCEQLSLSPDPSALKQALKFAMCSIQKQKVGGNSNQYIL